MTIASSHALLAVATLLAVAAANAGVVQVQVHDSVGKPLADAVVFLESREAAAAVRPAREAAIAQVDKQFSPRVTVVTVGTPVDFPNRDKVRHHVYSFSPAKTFELKLYAGTPANPVIFDRVGVAVLGCNIHDHMTAWVVVVDTPYYTRTTAGGQATLDGVPAGNYRLRAWHADLPVGTPASDQPITVTASGTAATVRLEEPRR